MSGCSGVGVLESLCEGEEPGDWSLSHGGRDWGGLDWRLFEELLDGDPDGDDWVPCSIVGVVVGKADCIAHRGCDFAYRA